MHLWRSYTKEQMDKKKYKYTLSWVDRFSDSQLRTRRSGVEITSSDK